MPAFQIVRVPDRPTELTDDLMEMIREAFGPETETAEIPDDELKDYYTDCLKIDGGQRLVEWLALLIECDMALTPLPGQLNSSRRDPDQVRADRKSRVRRRLVDMRLARNIREL